jgi:hypothetical protein
VQDEGVSVGCFETVSARSKVILNQDKFWAQDGKLISDFAAAVIQEAEAFDFGKVLPWR